MQGSNVCASISQISESCQHQTLNVDDLPKEFQMEVIELQSNDELRGKFQLASSPLEFFKRHIPRAEFPTISDHARRIAAIFGSTYVCEQLFSKMKYGIKNNLLQGKAKVKSFLKCMKDIDSV